MQQYNLYCLFGAPLPTPFSQRPLSLYQPQFWAIYEWWHNWLLPIAVQSQNTARLSVSAIAIAASGLPGGPIQCNLIVRAAFGYAEVAICRERQWGTAWAWVVRYPRPATRGAKYEMVLEAVERTPRRKIINPCIGGPGYEPCAAWVCVIIQPSFWPAWYPQCYGSSSGIVKTAAPLPVVGKIKYASHILALFVNFAAVKKSHSARMVSLASCFLAVCDCRVHRHPPSLILVLDAVPWTNESTRILLYAVLFPENPCSLTSRCPAPF